MKPVQISKKALSEIKNIMENKNIPNDYGLRLGIKGGQGCAGFNFLIGFDLKKEDDIAYVIDGVDVYIKKSQLMYVIGKEVDFHDGSDQRGFFFDDPEIKES